MEVLQGVGEKELAYAFLDDPYTSRQTIAAWLYRAFLSQVDLTRPEVGSTPQVCSGRTCLWTVFQGTVNS